MDGITASLSEIVNNSVSFLLLVFIPKCHCQVAERLRTSLSVRTKYVLGQVLEYTCYVSPVDFKFSLDHLKSLFLCLGNPCVSLSPSIFQTTVVIHLHALSPGAFKIISLGCPNSYTKPRSLKRGDLRIPPHNFCHDEQKQTGKER